MTATTWTVKCLQNLVKQKTPQGGFTLMELLVTIIIVGILAALALPAFLNQSAKARQAEAQQTIGTMNRGQQAYRLESQTFASSVSQLALGIPTNTKYFVYADQLAGGTEGQFNDLNQSFYEVAAIYATAKDRFAMRDYAGAAGAATDIQDHATTTTVLCAGSRPAAQSGAVLPLITYIDGDLRCNGD
jgi:prepilin-type N-terminal cleavage/methylation domain-containing protein